MELIIKFGFKEASVFGTTDSDGYNYPAFMGMELVAKYLVNTYEDRMKIRNPGGIYGRIKVDQLGKMQPDTRNPVLALVLETLRITKNRYSGIPTIRREMEKFKLKEPKFTDERGIFIVTFYKSGNISKAEPEWGEVNNLLIFCRMPRMRKEICEYLVMLCKELVSVILISA